MQCHTGSDFDFQAARLLALHDVSLERGFLGDDEAAVSVHASPRVRALEACIRTKLPPAVAAGPLALTESFASEHVSTELMDEPDAALIIVLLGVLRAAYASLYLPVPSKLACVHDNLCRVHRWPPILTYHQIVLANCCRPDTRAPLARHNCVPLVSIGAGFADFQAFVAACAMCELKGAAAVVSVVKCVLMSRAKTVDEAALAHELGSLKAHIDTVAIELVDGFLNADTRRIDPSGFFRFVRPQLKNSGDLHGASAAQSPLFATLDAGLGVEHDSPSGAFLRSEEAYMHPKHRALIAWLRTGGRTVRHAVLAAGDDAGAAFNACIDALVAFRRQHVLVAKEFVLAPSGASKAVGTGGLPVMSGVLLPAVAETRASKLVLKSY